MKSLARKTYDKSKPKWKWIELIKNYFKKYVLPEIPKWVPALVIAASSLIITYRTGLWQQQELKSQNMEKADSIRKQYLSLADTLIKLNSAVKNLDSAKIKLEGDTVYLNFKIASISKMVDSLKESMKSQYSQVQVYERKIGDLIHEKRELETEKRKQVLLGKLENILQNPFTRNTAVREIVSELKLQSDYVALITDRLLSGHQSYDQNLISYYIMYKGTSEIRYLEKILGTIESQLRLDFSDFHYGHPQTDALFDIFYNGDWTKIESRYISNFIVGQLNKESYLLTSFKNRLLQLIGSLVIKYGNGPDFLGNATYFDFLALNLNSLAEQAILLPPPVSALPQELTPNNQDTRSIDQHENAISYKVNLVRNLLLIAPQVYFAFEIKFNDIFKNNQIFKKPNLIQGFFLRMNAYKFPDNLCVEFLRAVPSYYPNDSIGILESGTLNLHDIPKLLNENSARREEFLKANSQDLNKWIERDFFYFRRNVDEFSDKINKCRF